MFYQEQLINQIKNLYLENNIKINNQNHKNILNMAVYFHYLFLKNNELNQDCFKDINLIQHKKSGLFYFQHFNLEEMELEGCFIIDNHKNYKLKNKKQFKEYYQPFEDSWLRTEVIELFNNKMFLSKKEIENLELLNQLNEVLLEWFDNYFNRKNTQSNKNDNVKDFQEIIIFFNEKILDEKLIKELLIMKNLCHKKSELYIDLLKDFGLLKSRNDNEVALTDVNRKNTFYLEDKNKKTLFPLSKRSQTNQKKFDLLKITTELYQDTLKQVVDNYKLFKSNLLSFEIKEEISPKQDKLELEDVNKIEEMLIATFNEKEKEIYQQVKKEEKNKHFLWLKQKQNKENLELMVVDYFNLIDEKNRQQIETSLTKENVNFCLMDNVSEFASENIDLIKNFLSKKLNFISPIKQEDVYSNDWFALKKTQNQFLNLKYLDELTEYKEAGRNPYILFALKQNEDLIGFINLTLKHNHFFKINTISISKPYRKQGYTDLLYQKSISILNKLNYVVFRREYDLSEDGKKYLKNKIDKMKEEGLLLFSYEDYSADEEKLMEKVKDLELKQEEFNPKHFLKVLEKTKSALKSCKDYEQFKTIINDFNEELRPKKTIKKGLKLKA